MGFLVPWAQGPLVLSFPLLTGEPGKAAGPRWAWLRLSHDLIFTERKRPFQSVRQSVRLNRSLEGRACQGLPEAPAAPGSVRSSSGVWGEAAQGTPLCSFTHSAIHSFIHSFNEPKSITCRASCEKRDLGGWQCGPSPSPPASGLAGGDARFPGAHGHPGSRAERTLLRARTPRRA